MLFTVLTLGSLLACSGQALATNREKIEKAAAELKNEMTVFNECLVKSHMNDCISALISSADNKYEKYIIGGMLYEIDPKQSFKLHEEAYLSDKQELYFILEYALELHRIGKFKEAAVLYETLLKKIPDDIRINVWLADCYINTGDIDKSVSNWLKADHGKNHTGIDFAIHTVYGKTTQIKDRDDYRISIEKGNYEPLFLLIYLDANWELDWWNHNIQETFLAEDIALVKKMLGETNNDFKILQAYLDIKKLEKEEGQSIEIKKILTDNKIILEDYPLPASGKIMSDLLRICFTNHLLSDSGFYSKRGSELLEFAKKTKDKDLLNIYAYLQANTEGQVNPEIDKLGWKEFQDERFACSYFIGKANSCKYDDIELNQALKDFPSSSILTWIKAKCAKIENKPVKQHLIDLIKKEFQTLGSDEGKFSYRLKSYYATLQSEK